jgi:CheY-like chemotaxis protein
MNTAALLKDLGHDVIEAEDGERALKFASERLDIDLPITDQATPRMPGPSLSTGPSRSGAAPCDPRKRLRRRV